MGYVRVQTVDWKDGFPIRWTRQGVEEAMRQGRRIRAHSWPAPRLPQLGTTLTTVTWAENGAVVHGQIWDRASASAWWVLTDPADAEFPGELRLMDAGGPPGPVRYRPSGRPA